VLIVESPFFKDLCSSCIGRGNFYLFEVRRRFVGSSKFLHNGATTYFAVSLLFQNIISHVFFGSRNYSKEAFS